MGEGRLKETCLFCWAIYQLRIQGEGNCYLQCISAGDTTRHQCVVPKTTESSGKINGSQNPAKTKDSVKGTQWWEEFDNNARERGE